MRHPSNVIQELLGVAVVALTGKQQIAVLRVAGPLLHSRQVLLDDDAQVAPTPVILAWLQFLRAGGAAHDHSD